MTIKTRRKRSRAAGLTAIGALGMLAGCDGGPNEDELSRAQFGEPTEVSMFRSVSECVGNGEFDLNRCTEAEKTAWNEDQTSAPRFENETDCEDQFGFGNCRTGSGYFMPIMTGFMIGSFLNAGRPNYRYAGLYRDERDDDYYSGSGAWLHKKKSKSGKYLIGSKAFDRVAPKVQTRSDIASRGGFGGRVAMGRGGGGGGSWGGVGHSLSFDRRTYPAHGEERLSPSTLLRRSLSKARLEPPPSFETRLRPSSGSGPQPLLRMSGLCF